MSAVILSDESLENVSGGFNPVVDSDAVAFQYEGFWWKKCTGPYPLSSGYWACRLDGNGNPTGVIIQVPN